MTGRASLSALFVLLAALAWSGAARAALDPVRAQADADAAMNERGYSFCREPREPLSRRARALCPHAAEIPGCEGFAAACARAEGKAATAPTPSSGGAGGASSGAPAKPLTIPSFLGMLAQGLVWLLVAALVLAVLVPIVRALVRIRRDKELADPQPQAAPQPAEAPVVELPATTDEDLLLRRAEDLAKRGEYGAALQLYLAASLRALDKRGAVRIAKDRTNGEYVRACSDAAAKPALRDIVREVDRAQFGGEHPTADAVSRAGQRAVAIVRALPLALLAVALACVLGCGRGAGASAKGAPDGDDPADDGLFYDVLQRQGVKVEPLSISLASLPLPQRGERAAAVVVDVERTQLDDETHEHLVAWVDAGGVLVLAGDASRWPSALEAGPADSTGPHAITARRLLAAGAEGAGDDDDDEVAEASGGPVFSEGTVHGELVSGHAVTLRGQAMAWFGDATQYAVLARHGQGWVLGIATDELMTNAGLARPGNAAAMVAILSAADRLEMRVAQPDDGVAPPSSPIAALKRAGLGLGMGHALFAALALFLAVGIRLSRPKPAPPPLRRAFAEHVEAVGALYARTGNAPHALAAYARFADERLRVRMPRGTSDVAAFLASRAGLPLDVCQRVWTRAMAAKAGAPPLGDELAVLKELSAVYSAAMVHDR